MKGDPCPCIDIHHPHKSGECPNTERPIGPGSCQQCRDFDGEVAHPCPLCGAPTLYVQGEAIYVRPQGERTR